MKSSEEVNLLNDEAARMRCAIMKRTAGREGFETIDYGQWPESPEKDAMRRLREAFHFWKTDASNDAKYRVLSEALDFAKERLIYF